MSPAALCITGCGLSFRRRFIDDGRTVNRDGVQHKVPEKFVSFNHGSIARAIHKKEIQLALNHTIPSDFPTQAAGTLDVWESVHGCYFAATLPDTALGHEVYAAVVAGKIRHLCMCSTSTESTQEGDTTVISRADCFMLTLLLTAPPHDTATWVWTAGPLADERIALEEETARLDHWWALDAAVLAEDTYGPPAAGSDADRRMRQVAGRHAPIYGRIRQRLNAVQAEHERSQVSTVDR